MDLIKPQRALVVGSQGQDGRILVASLKNQGYDVFEISRKSGPSIFDAPQVRNFIQEYQPHEIYFLAAVSHASENPSLANSANLLEESRRVHVVALRNFLEAFRDGSPQSRLFYASSSHVFGDSPDPIQNEESPVLPNSAYALTKVEGMDLCREFRLKHGCFAAVGILYNHESALRPSRYLSKKIVDHLVALLQDSPVKLDIGDLNAQADWGYAPDFIDAMQRIIRFEEADDFVVATGELHTVRDFLEVAFSSVGREWNEFVRVKPEILLRRSRPLVGDASKLREATGWRPTLSFKEMVEKLVRDRVSYLSLETHLAKVEEKAKDLSP